MATESNVKVEEVDAGKGPKHSDPTEIGEEGDPDKFADIEEPEPVKR